MNKSRTNYRFVLPQMKREPVGKEGEVAQYISYRLEGGMTMELIQQELEQQPHMAPLLDHLDPARRIYLLGSSNVEVLELAAEYIGTYHRIANSGDFYYDSIDEEEDAAEEASGWEEGGGDFRTVDFSQGMPYVEKGEVSLFYSSNKGLGFGNQMYLPNQQARHRPWWTLSLNAPIVISNFSRYEGNMGFCFGTGYSDLPELLQNMSERSLIILLCYQEKDSMVSNEYLDLDMDSVHSYSIDDLSFELETDWIRLEPPRANSQYKKDILCQMAEERGTPLVRPADAGRILSILEDRRGNTDNQTVSKAVSNALLRRKGDGPLTMKDFKYLSAIFTSKKKVKEKKGSMEMVGQEEVRRQLEGIVSSMAFQAKRKRLGLPQDAIHYTFAFMGPPGTGKTTWARWLGDEMAKRGLLDNTSLICVNAAELKARYVGHTTGKVHALFEQYGIIILDEAYSLTEGEYGDSFGAEALSQLCVELENHGGDRLVIFAGYGGASDPSDNRMLRFLQSNPGIASRVSFKIHFKDFQVPELVEVLRTMLTFDGYRLPQETDQRAEAFFRSRVGRRAFGNCREARNLADRIKIHTAARLADVKNCTREVACRIQLEDIDQAILEITQEIQGLDKNEGRSIGFS